MHSIKHTAHVQKAGVNKQNQNQNQHQYLCELCLLVENVYFNM